MGFYVLKYKVTLATSYHNSDVVFDDKVSVSVLVWKQNVLELSRILYEAFPVQLICLFETFVFYRMITFS